MLDAESAARELLRCCGSQRWAQRMVAARPFADADTMSDVADDIWWSLDAADWLGAFAAHPRIGDGGDAGAGEAGRAGAAGGAGGAERAGRAGTAGQGTAGWSGQEQARVADAAATVRQRLDDLNREYEARFGYIFIVSATGRSAEEMLGILERRLQNDPGEELQAAAEEQRTITRLRLMKLLEQAQVP